ncbi:peroxisome assembly protein (Peroxin-2) [Chytridiales sp. JEL 0842]|nr:peroxisome assembly protein (Peroxin-2) [Chytridiales sp. JEL 0842]
MLQLLKIPYMDSYKPELEAFLRALVYAVPLFTLGATYGMQMQNLSYRNERAHRGKLGLAYTNAPLSRTQKWLYLLLGIGGPWSWSRLNIQASRGEWSEKPEADWRHKVWKLLQRVDPIHKGLSLLNFLVFLYNGKYPTLVDRILSMRTVYKRREQARQVSFDYMNRQMVWEAFTVRIPDDHIAAFEFT